jgi:rubrerythrin
MDESREDRDFRRAVEDFEMAVGAFLEDPAANEVQLTRTRNRVMSLYITKMGPDLWTCPDCAFSFAAEHTNNDGDKSGHSCPLCESARLRAELSGQP